MNSWTRWLVGLAGEAKRAGRERDSVRGAPSYIWGLGWAEKAGGLGIAALAGPFATPRLCGGAGRPGEEVGPALPSPTCPASHAVFAGGSQARGRPQPTAPWAHAPRRSHGGDTGEGRVRRVALSSGPASRSGPSRCSHPRPQRCGSLPVFPATPISGCQGRTRWGVGRSLPRGRASWLSVRFPRGLTAPGAAGATQALGGPETR